MQHFPDGVSLLQLVHLLDDEVLPVLSLTAHLLLDGSRIWSYGQMVLANFPPDSWEVGWFPGEHVHVLPEKSHEIRFLSCR